MAEVDVEAEAEREFEPLEEKLSKSWDIAETGDNANEWAVQGTNGVGQTWETCYPDQTEWMGIRTAGKGREAGFW